MSINVKVRVRVNVGVRVRCIHVRPGGLQVDDIPYRIHTFQVHHIGQLGLGLGKVLGLGLGLGLGLVDLSIPKGIPRVIQVVATSTKEGEP